MDRILAPSDIRPTGPLENTVRPEPEISRPNAAPACYLGRPAS